MNLFTSYLLLFITSLRVHGKMGYPETVIHLSANYHPTQAFTLSSVARRNISLGILNSSENVTVGYIHYKYKLNVVIESINWSSKKDNNARLVIENGNKTIFQFCTNVKNSDRNFEMGKEIFDGESQVNISLVGDEDWTGLEANLVASLYYEATGSCENCSDEHFCCDGSQCNSGNITAVRCILKNSLREGKPLLCDGHPNCGRFCNADESVVFCGNSAETKCPKNDCPVDGLKITLIILGVFALLSVIYAVIVMSRTVRTFLGISSFFPMPRSPHEDVDENNSTADSNSVRSIFVYVNNLSIATISRPENDSPPNYHELDLRNKVEIKVEEINNADLDLPSFTEAVSFEYRGFSQITPSGNGILNPAYGHYYDDSQSQKSEIEKY